MENKFSEEQLSMENRWAVYPIEKVEAAMKALSEAIAEARKTARELAYLDDTELDKILCPGCRDDLYKDGPMHIYLDGDGMEPCIATDERKRKLKEYFAKNNPVPR